MDQAVELAQESARRARNAAVLAMLALAVAVAVLAIDNTIKKSILDEARRVRDMLDEAGAALQAVTATKEAHSGKKAAGDAGAPDSPGVDGSGVLVDAPRAPAAADSDAGPGHRPAARGPDGKFTGARGDG